MKATIHIRYRALPDRNSPSTGAKTGGPATKSSPPELAGFRAGNLKPALPLPNRLRHTISHPTATSAGIASEAPSDRTAEAEEGDGVWEAAEEGELAGDGEVEGDERLLRPRRRHFLLARVSIRSVAEKPSRKEQSRQAYE